MMFASHLKIKACQQFQVIFGDSDLLFFAGSILHNQLKDVSLWSKMSFVNLVTRSSSQIQRQGASYQGCNKREENPKLCGQ